jgi:hypothetical protein
MKLSNPMAKSIRLAPCAAAVYLVAGCGAPPGDEAPGAADQAATAQMAAPAPAAAPPVGGEESRNMRLVGHHTLQGRSAYHPVPHRYGERMIFFVGHHEGEAQNDLTGQVETNGTSIIDVTDPASPVLLKHLPPRGEAEEAQHVQLCNGADLPNADDNVVYMIVDRGAWGSDLYDATDPANPQFLREIYTTGESNRARRDTHKMHWDCASGIAYLNGTPEGWNAHRVLRVFDMSTPEEPRHIRDFGLDGMQPGGTADYTAGLHQPLAYGNRVFLGYGASGDGVVQILDRDRLLNGDPEAPEDQRFEPTAENLVYPQIGRLDMPSYYGAHTAKPIYDMEIADYADNGEHKETADNCASDRDIMWLVDITEEDKPFPISSFQVPEEPGDFCHRGVRFGPHSPQDAYHPYFDKSLLLLAYFNAGVRAIDIRNPYQPVEVGFYIPALTENTVELCDDETGTEICGRAIQTNNVNIDDRGYVYIVDRAGTGAHILELTGDARQVVGL